jgi:hypothetical protein
VKQAQHDGRTWFHQIIGTAHSCADDVPYRELGSSIPQVDELMNALPESDMVQLVETEMQRLQIHKDKLAEKKKVLGM